MFLKGLLNLEDKKLMTIGEIAKSIGITRRIIINYEQHNLIQADTRGENKSGYRYYSMDTLVRIRTIRTFQNLGLSLEEIRKYLDGSTDLLPILERLEKLRDEINLSIEKVRERINDSDKANVMITALPQQTVYCTTMRDDTIKERTEHLRDIAYIAISYHGTDLSKRMYFIEYPMDDVNLITYCASIPTGSKGKNVINLSEKRALSLYHHGGYEELPAVREVIVQYAKEHQIELDNVCRHTYLEGPPHHKDPRNFITMVSIPLKE